MSKFIPTSLGVFRYFEGADSKGFLFLCPECGEWLPMEEETLAARKPVDHLSVDHVSHNASIKPCSYVGVREYGKVLVSTMQARRIMRLDGEDIRVYVTDEAEAIQQSGRLMTS